MKKDTQFIARFSSLYPPEFAISMAFAAEALLPLAKKHTTLIKKKPKSVEKVRDKIRGIIAMRCPRLRVEWRESKPSVVIRYGRKHKNELEVA